MSLVQASPSSPVYTVSTGGKNNLLAGDIRAIWGINSGASEKNRLSPIMADWMIFLNHFQEE